MQNSNDFQTKVYNALYLLEIMLCIFCHSSRCDNLCKQTECTLDTRSRGKHFSRWLDTFTYMAYLSMNKGMMINEKKIKNKINNILELKGQSS